MTDSAQSDVVSGLGRALQRGAVLILVAAVLAGIVAFVGASQRPATYTASSLVLVNVDPTKDSGTVDDRTTASEAAFASSDAMRQQVADAAGPSSGSYTVSPSAGENTLTFTASSGSAGGALTTARTAADTYVATRQDGLESGLQKRLNAGQQVIESITKQLDSIPQNESTTAQRAAYAEQLSSALVSRQDLEQQLASVRQVATVISQDGAASRSGSSAAVLGVLGALLGALLMVLAIAVRDRMSPRFRGVGPMMRDTDVFTVSAGRGARPAVLGAAAVSIPFVAPGSFLAVIGPARPTTIEKITEAFRSRQAGADSPDGAPAAHVVDLGASEFDLGDLPAVTAEAREHGLPLIVHGNDARAEEVISELAAPGDVLAFVAEPDVSSLKEVTSRLEPVRRSPARMVWLLATGR